MTNPPERKHPPTQFTKNRIGGCPIFHVDVKRPSPPHKSYFLRPTSYISRQLFIRHQSTEHTFPIAQKTSEPKVHEVCRDSRVVRTIELSHFCLSSCFYCARWFPHRVSLLVPYAAILSRPATVPCGFPQGLSLYSY